MIFDLNLSELPAYKNYDGFLPELFNFDDNKIIKEIVGAWKRFSKTSFNQVFLDFAFYTLRDYLKRCRFGFCNLWIEEELQSEILKVSSWVEPVMTYGVPGLGSLLTSLLVLLIYNPVGLVSTPEIDGFQSFYICLVSVVSTGLSYFSFGLINVASAVYMVSNS